MVISVRLGNERRAASKRDSSSSYSDQAEGVRCAWILSKTSVDVMSTSVNWRARWRTCLRFELRDRPTQSKSFIWEDSLTGL
jgi:hypothetical protein